MVLFIDKVTKTYVKTFENIWSDKTYVRAYFAFLFKKYKLWKMSWEVNERVPLLFLR